MSKELVNRILNDREEATTAADGIWHGWKQTELRLAEYAAELQAENARLTAGLARIADDYYAEHDMDAPIALSEMREALMALLTKDGE
jgi:hypothetical protein